MKSSNTKSTNMKSITITPTHTLVGDEAIPSSNIDHIHLVLENGEIFDVQVALALLGKKSKKVRKPLQLSKRFGNAFTAFKAAIEETQSEQEAP